MSGKSDIEWTDKTWNPVRGCVKVSPGCKRCYAEAFAERWRGIQGHAYEQGFDPRLVQEQLGAPLKWRKPSRIFVNSMSDLFGAFVPDAYIAAVFAIIAAADQHTYQILTKRAERLPQWFARWEREWPEWPSQGVWDAAAEHYISGLELYDLVHDAWEPERPWPLPNVWIGVSVEDRKYGIQRIEYLRQTPAAVRFLSIEPLLEDIADDLDCSGIDWVIIGCESGHGARPFRMEWAERIIEVAKRAGSKVFLKQAPHPMHKGKVVSLPVLNGQQWTEFPGTP